MLSFPYLEVKAQQCFVNSSCTFLCKKTLLKNWIYSGLNLTIFRGTRPRALRLATLRTQRDLKRVQSNLSNIYRHQRDRGVRIIEVGNACFLAFLGPNELSVIERCPFYRGVRNERLDCTDIVIIWDWRNISDRDKPFWILSKELYYTHVLLSKSIETWVSLCMSGLCALELWISPAFCQYFVDRTYVFTLLIVVKLDYE